MHTDLRIAIQNHIVDLDLSWNPSRSHGILEDPSIHRVVHMKKVSVVGLTRSTAGGANEMIVVARYGGSAVEETFLDGNRSSSADDIPRANETTLFAVYVDSKERAIVLDRGFARGADVEEIVLDSGTDHETHKSAVARDGSIGLHHDCSPQFPEQSCHMRRTLGV